MYICMYLSCQFGHTALFMAAERGHDQVVKMLLDSGANIEIAEEHNHV